MRFLWLLSILLAGVLVMSVMANDAEGGEGAEGAGAEGAESAGAEGAESGNAENAEGAGNESGEGGESNENEENGESQGENAESGEDEEEPCNKLHAAFTFHQTDFFVYGDNQLAGFSFKGERWYSGLVEHIGFNDTVTSAFGDVWNHRFFLQSGREEQGYNKFKDESVYKPLYYSGADYFFIHNPEYQGIDAAFMRGPNHVVYLAGCEYAIVEFPRKRLVSAGRSDWVDIPCHPDAAWSSPNLEWAFIAKGDKVYPMYWLDYYVRPVRKLLDAFPYLESLNLCA